MRPFPESLTDLLDQPFLTSPDWERFAASLQKRVDEIGTGESVLCAEADPVSALAVIFATVLQGGGVFLANPGGKKVEWDELGQLTGFHQIYGTEQFSVDPSRAKYFSEPRVMIPSGGTTGHSRWCVHSLNTLTASVESLYLHKGEGHINSLGLLPVYHVSGLMPVFRALLTGGIVELSDWKKIESGERPRLPGHPCFLSLVPAQLSSLVRTEHGLRFLHRFDTIFLGGASTPSGLVHFIRGEKLPVEFVYGLTETAAMVVYGTRGDTDETGAIWGQALPGVSVSLTEEGEIWIRSKSLFRGYFPEDREHSVFKTGDVGRWVTKELIQVLGRRDFLINTGGEKVNPEEVEACLASLLPGVPVAVGSRPDKHWGEAVVALLASNLTQDQLNALTRNLSNHLAPYKIPKEIITGVQIPVTSLGKLNRHKLRRFLSQ